MNNEEDKGLVDVSRFVVSVKDSFGIDCDVFVKVADWQNLLDKKALLPDVEVHIGDGFVSLRNKNGEHVFSVGFMF